MAAVNNVASLAYANYALQSRNSTRSNSSTQAQSAQNQSTQTKSAQVGDAFALDISDAAKQTQQSQQTPAQMLEGFSVEDDADAQKTTESKAELADALAEDYMASQQNLFKVMIQALGETNDKLKGWLDEGVGILNFNGTQIDAARFGLPEVATNPEDAKKAISEDGEWSVGAVSDRIFNLAMAFAGDDPEKISQMKSAIEEGFKQAGMVWKDTTGQSDMPSITKDTYNEIMSRFDKRTNELNGTSVVE